MNAIRLILSTALLLTLTCSVFALQDDEINFVEQIKPIIEKHCLSCHGEEDPEAGMRVDVKDDVIDLYIEPGDSGASDYYDRLISDDENYVMPPPEEPRLTEEEIALVKAWIDQGADWPDEDLVFLVPPSVDSADAANEATDTSDDQEETKDFWVLLWENCGVLHPAVVHFPIALLIGGAFFALFGFRGDSPMGDAAYYCLWLAAVSGIVTCVVGWSYAQPGMHPNGAKWDDFELSKTIVQHRWGGILVTVLSLILAMIATSTRRRDPYASGALWKIGMILTAALCGYVGHLGGDMTHHGEMEKAIERLGIFEQADDDGGAEEDASNDEGSGEPSSDGDSAPGEPGEDDPFENPDEDDA